MIKKTAIKCDLNYIIMLRFEVLREVIKLDKDSYGVQMGLKLSNEAEETH